MKTINEYNTLQRKEAIALLQNLLEGADALGNSNDLSKERELLSVLLSQK